MIAGTPESRRKSRSSNERRSAVRCTVLNRQPMTSRVRSRAERMRGRAKQGTHIASGVLRSRRIARSSCPPSGRLRRGFAEKRHCPSCATTSNCELFKAGSAAAGLLPLGPVCEILQARYGMSSGIDDGRDKIETGVTNTP
jgi:hypothetical protein